MKTKLFTSIAILSLLSAFVFAGETVKEAEFKVFGNCNQCKTRIEKSMKISEVKKAKWDTKSKMLKVAYLSDKISLDSLEQRVASVGHDTEKFKAADSVYAELPGCCLYRSGESKH
jgi:mercuric ion binding protein